MPYGDIIDKHFKRVGLDPALGRRIMKIESGGDPRNVTGSYKGLFQLDEGEFKRHGGTGSIYDPDANTAAAANLLAKKAQNFKEKTGRDAKPIDIYMMHQQGEAGYSAHLANPDAPAWRNIRKYYSSDEIAKQAVWGNIPDKDKAQFGSVENVTSKQFVSDVWGRRVEGGEAEFGEGGEATVASARGRTIGKAVDEAVDTKKPSILGEEADPVRAAWLDFPVPQAPEFSGTIKSRAIR